MKKLSIFCTFLICFTAVLSLMKPIMKSSPKPESYIAKDLRKASYREFPNLRIPNKQFCDDRPLKPAEHYLVLPWWYHYCQAFMDKKIKKYNKGLYYLPLYKKILDKLQVHKKNKMIEQQRAIRERMGKQYDPLA